MKMISIISTALAFLLEGFLAIPIIGGASVIASGYSLLFIALVLHIVALVSRFKFGTHRYAPIMGIICSLLAWIPLVGMALHAITFITYLVDLLQKNEKPKE